MAKTWCIAWLGLLVTASAQAQGGLGPLIGEAGGECLGDGSCNEGLSCVDGVCTAATPPSTPPPTAPSPTPPSTTPPSTTPPSTTTPSTTAPTSAAGAEGGACYPNGTCDPGLRCDGGTCQAHTGPAEGSRLGPCYPNQTCHPGLRCRDGQCVLVERGVEGGACYPNQTCNQGLSCVEGSCVGAPAGSEGGACYGNRTCNAPLACRDGRCVRAEREERGYGQDDDESTDEDRYGAPRSPRKGGRAGGALDDEDDGDDEEGPAPSTSTRPADLRGSGIASTVGHCIGAPISNAGCAAMGFGCFGAFAGASFLALGTSGAVGEAQDNSDAVLGGTIAIGVGILFTALGLPVLIGGLAAHGYSLYSTITATLEAFDLDAALLGVVAIIDALGTVLLAPTALGGGLLLASFLALVGGLVIGSLVNVVPPARALFYDLGTLGFPLGAAGVGVASTGLGLLGVALLLDATLIGGSFFIDAPGPTLSSREAPPPTARSASRMRF